MGGHAPGAPPPRSANELGCQANGGARAGRAPPLDPPMLLHIHNAQTKGTQCKSMVKLVIKGGCTFWSTHSIESI